MKKARTPSFAASPAKMSSEVNGVSAPSATTAIPPEPSAPPPPLPVLITTKPKTVEPVSAVSLASADSTTPGNDTSSASKEDEPHSAEERQRRWMTSFIETECKTAPIDYMRRFMDIRMAQESLRTQEAYTCMTSSHPAHYIRNRYRDILPYDSNRVQLVNGTEDTENDDGYINASHIELPRGKTKFIAAQAPLPSTLEDFWQMVDEQGVQLIVMLCKLIEMSKVKCERYWPEHIGATEIYGDYEVTLEKEETFDDDEYILRSLSMQRISKVASIESGISAGSKQLIHQLHYREWPDHGCPTGDTQLLNMIDRLAELAAEHPSHPVLVHCSAGVGRTGTIIAVNYVRELIKQNLAYDLDIFSLVMTLRKQRSSMVQTQDQYQFVHRCIGQYCRHALGMPAPLGAMERVSIDSRCGGANDGQVINLEAPLLPSPPAFVAPPAPLANGNKVTDKNDENDDEEGTSIPDYPEEPKAPRGPEDLSGVI